MNHTSPFIILLMASRFLFSDYSEITIDSPFSKVANSIRIIGDNPITEKQHFFIVYTRDFESIKIELQKRSAQYKIGFVIMDCAVKNSDDMFNMVLKTFDTVKYVKGNFNTAIFNMIACSECTGMMFFYLLFIGYFGYSSSKFSFLEKLYENRKGTRLEGLRDTRTIKQYLPGLGVFIFALDINYEFGKSKILELLKEYVSEEMFKSFEYKMCRDIRQSTYLIDNILKEEEIDETNAIRRHLNIRTVVSKAQDVNNLLTCDVFWINIHGFFTKEIDIQEIIRMLSIE